MRSQSPAESCLVLEPDELIIAGPILLGVRRNGEVLGLGALAPQSANSRELKSMHARSDARGQGIRRKILLAVIDEARNLGMGEVCIETGTAPVFVAARSLYVSKDFVKCAVFGNYSAEPLCVLMTCSL